MRAFGKASEMLLPVDEAVARVLSAIEPLGTEAIPLSDALNRILREDVVASEDVPPSDNSAMDGYAVRSADTTSSPARLRVLGDLAAGGAAHLPVEEGTAVRIMTGAPIPSGADAVAQVEITDGGSETVTINRAVRAGTNVRRRGDDMRAGSIVLRDGAPLGPSEIGVAASARRETLNVGRRATVAIIATGDELRADAPARIIDSNSFALSAMVSSCGGVPRRYPIVRDTLDATVAAIEGALECDFVITTGGISVGAWDFVKEALETLGATTHFWRVAMKPGKPVLFAELRERKVFALPGNPVSAMVSFTLFAAPAIRKAQGQKRDLTAPVVSMRTLAALKGAADRRAYLRVRVVARGGELVAEPMRAQESHIATSMVQANGLAIVDTDAIEAGAMVPVMLIGPISSSS